MELTRVEKFSAGTAAIGALAVGALAFGALAIGALAIGRLVIRKASIGIKNLTKIIMSNWRRQKVLRKRCY